MKLLLQADLWGPPCPASTGVHHTGLLQLQKWPADTGKTSPLAVNANVHPAPKSAKHLHTHPYHVQLPAVDVVVHPLLLLLQLVPAALVRGAQSCRVPGMLLDVLEGDALLGVDLEDLVQQVLALGGQLQVRMAAQLSLQSMLLHIGTSGRPELPGTGRQHKAPGTEGQADPHLGTWVKRGFRVAADRCQLPRAYQVSHQPQQDSAKHPQSHAGGMQIMHRAIQWRGATCAGRSGWRCLSSCLVKAASGHCSLASGAPFAHLVDVVLDVLALPPTHGSLLHPAGE